jgi:hypothetical protein
MRRPVCRTHAGRLRAYRRYGADVSERRVPRHRTLVTFSAEATRPAKVVDVALDGFAFHDAEINDAYWDAHRRYEADGKIHHRASDCPERRAVHEILSWTPHGNWQKQPFTFGAPGVGLAVPSR